MGATHARTKVPSWSALAPLAPPHLAEVEDGVCDLSPRGVDLLLDVEFLGPEEGRDLAENAGLVLVHDAQAPADVPGLLVKDGLRRGRGREGERGGKIRAREGR